MNAYDILNEKVVSIPKDTKIQVHETFIADDIEYIIISIEYPELKIKVIPNDEYIKINTIVKDKNGEYRTLKEIELEMNKDLVKNIIKEDLELNEFIDVYISKEELYINDICDCMGTKIFDSYNNYKGWLIFIDPCNIANWSHECMYWFIVDREIIKNNNGRWFPKDEVEQFK